MRVGFDFEGGCGTVAICRKHHGAIGTFHAKIGKCGIAIIGESLAALEAVAVDVDIMLYSIIVEPVAAGAGDHRNARGNANGS